VQGKDKNSRETRNVHRLLIGKAYFKGKVKEDDSRKKSFFETNVGVVSCGVVE
jgi:hypothetical protein